MRSRSPPNGRTAYVKSPEGVIPINTATNTAGQLIKISSPEDAVWPMETLTLSTPGEDRLRHQPEPGRVTPISTATNKVGQPIKVGKYPFALAVTPNGKVVEVIDHSLNTVTPISTVTNKAGQPIGVGTYPSP
jgi:DNA-binding beta-propeller fold protein YncE